MEFSAIVVLPTYNEADNLCPLVEKLLDLDCRLDVLIVDDNSPDGTGHQADRLAAANHRVSVLHQPGKTGLGAAYVHAFSTLLNASYDAVCQMDADGSHDPETLPALLAGLAENDLVIGSRFVPEGRHDPHHPFRRWLSKAANALIRTTTHIPIHDATSGYRCFRRETLQRMDITTIQSRSFSFQTEMVLRAHKLGFKIAEYPIVFRQRKIGASKLGVRTFWESLWLLWRYRRVRRLPT